jgi:putative NADPH-quinone reductase
MREAYGGLMGKKTLVVLAYCGIKVNSISEFSPVKSSSGEKREKWLKRARELGEKS